MGSCDGEFDAWLERALARELGRIRRMAPSHDWTRPRPRVRGPVLAGTGGALVLKGATGLAFAALAVGATGTAMTGQADPVAWAQAVQEATAEVLPVRPEAAAPPPRAVPVAPAPVLAGPPSGADAPDGQAANGHAGRPPRPANSPRERGHGHGAGAAESAQSARSHN